MTRLPRRRQHTPRPARRPRTHRRQLAVGRPGLAVTALTALTTIAALTALAGCSGSSSSSSQANAASSAGYAGAAGSAASAPLAAASASAAAAPAGNPAGGVASGAGTGQAASAARLVLNSQQLIYTASLTVRANQVGVAVSRATAIAASEGGYVSSENASDDPNHPDRSTATVELKIPVARYSAALHDLTQASLGTQLSLRQQTQDVTEQVANVNSRVTSDAAAIAQLRALLRHAGTISGLLSVQDQINAQESDLEALQAQQSALGHETAYATVTLTVIGPRAAPRRARAAHTPGLVSGLVAGWHAFRTSVSWLLAIIGAVAPFAAVIVVIGGFAYLARRWHVRRGRPSGASPAAPASPADR